MKLDTLSLADDLRDFPDLGEESVEYIAANTLWKHFHEPMLYEKSPKDLVDNPPREALYVFNQDCRDGVMKFAGVDISHIPVIAYLEEIETISPEFFNRKHGIDMSRWNQRDPITAQSLALEIGLRRDSHVSFYTVDGGDISYVRSSVFTQKKDPYVINPALLFKTYSDHVFETSPRSYVSWQYVKDQFDRA